MTAFTPTIELQAAAAAGLARETMGMDSKTSCQGWLMKKLGHIGVTVLGTAGTVGVAGVIYGSIYSQPITIALGAIFGLTGYSTAVCMWYYIPDKILEANVKDLNLTITTLTSEIKSLKAQIANLSLENQTAKVNLDLLSQTLSKKTDDLSAVASQLETTRQALQKLQDLHLKYQTTTSGVLNAIKDLKGLNPEMAARIGQIAGLIKEDKNAQGKFEEERKEIDLENQKVDELVKSSSSTCEQLHHIGLMIQELIIPAKEVSEERVALSQTIDKLTSENEQFKQMIAQFESDQKRADATVAELNAALESFMKIKLLTEANAALREADV
jgi:chromosome segregation ATPase